MSVTTAPTLSYQKPVPLHLPTWMTFAVAGGSGMTAWLFCHPTDVVKVRMQLAGVHSGHVNPVTVAKHVITEEGVAGLYKGLSAGMTRQAVYTTLRLGLYDKIKDMVSDMKPGQPLTVLDRAATGLAAGGVASFISCPIEVCLVRMQADGHQPVHQRRNYKGIVNALTRIGSEEGVTGFWKGASPTVYRAMVVSMTQLGTYDQAKSMLTPVLGDGTACHLTSALTAAVVYSFASLPLDTAKTRVQSQRAGFTKYKSTIQTLGIIVKEEGASKLWKGFTPYFARSGMHTVLMFMFKELYEEQGRKFLSTHSHSS